MAGISVSGLNLTGTVVPRFFHKAGPSPIRAREIRRLDGDAHLDNRWPHLKPHLPTGVIKTS